MKRIVILLIVFINIAACSQSRLYLDEKTTPYPEVMGDLDVINLKCSSIIDDRPQYRDWLRYENRVEVEKSKLTGKVDGVKRRVCKIGTKKGSDMLSAHAFVSFYDEGIINEKPFTLYSDGSGFLRGNELGNEDKWSFSCTSDKIDDTKTCRISHSKYSDAFSILKKGNEYYVFIGHNIHPGTISQIRVDKNSHFSTENTAGLLTKDKSNQLITEMLSGEAVYVRYYPWPSGIVEYEFPLKNLKDVMDLTDIVGNYI